jgi:hypothetical protein
MNGILVIALVWLGLIVFGLALVRAAAIGDRCDERRRRTRARRACRPREPASGVVTRLLVDRRRDLPATTKFGRRPR